MDDFNIGSLTESRNEYSSLFVIKLTPCLIQGITSIFNDACELCIENNEDEKYLMTFQNLLGRVIKWNQEIIHNETDRIIKETNCNYLEDLLTCVHVTQLKILTNVRVGTKQKKVTIDIPKLETFIHKCYIELARKIYKNVFLYDRSSVPLTMQKNMRELELITKECIFNVIRENMPIEEILKSYLDEGIEELAEEEKTEVKEVQEVKDEIIEPDDKPQVKELEKSKDNDNHKSQVIDIETAETELKPHVTTIKNQGLQFNDKDIVKSYDGDENSGSIHNIPVVSVNAPKDIKTLEDISDMRYSERREDKDEDEDEDEYGGKLNIMEDTNIKLDIERIDPKSIQLEDALILNDVEVLK
jgi:hypothetical protein